MADWLELLTSVCVRVNVHASAVHLKTETPAMVSFSFAPSFLVLTLFPSSEGEHWLETRLGNWLGGIHNKCIRLDNNEAFQVKA